MRQARHREDGRRRSKRRWPSVTAARRGLAVRLAAADGPLAAPAPSRKTERRTSGRCEQLGRRAVEADLALLHEVRRLGDGEGDVDRLLDEDDRRAPVADGAHDPEQLLDDDRRQAQRQLVDHQAAGAWR